jgi:hypothetical protein
MSMSSEIAKTTVDTNIGESIGDDGHRSSPASFASAEAPRDITDKRGRPRIEITRKVHMGTGLGPSLECELKDISQTGARLRFNDPNCAPQEFLVRLNDGVLRWCQVMWRSKTEIGIRFIKTPKSFVTKAKAQDAPAAEPITQSDKSAEASTDKVHSEGAPDQTVNS